jgi:hypothetical protein
LVMRHACVDDRVAIALQFVVHARPLAQLDDVGWLRRELPEEVPVGAQRVGEHHVCGVDRCTRRNAVGTWSEQRNRAPSAARGQVRDDGAPAKGRRFGP